MAKKVITRKKHGDGSQASLNKLKPPPPVEISHGLRGGGDKVRNQNATEVPIKKLIDEELSRRKKNVQSPSVVARLMGVDMLPSHWNPVPMQVVVDKKHEARRSTLIDEKNIAKNDSVVGHHLSRTSKSARQKRSVSLDSVEESVSSDQWSYDKLRNNKPRKREHPQEEELQKFKEEFETWLTERVKKCSKSTIEFGKTPSQLLARENLNRQKMAFYEHSKTMTENVKPREPKGGPNRKNKNGNVTRSDQLAEVDLAPSKIVILRPGPDSIGGYEECLSSPSTSRESTSIEDFLEEVKGRLKKATTTGGGFEATYNEYPSDPKQIAQRIAKHVRESVTRDLGRSLFRSESTRSYRSELHVNDETDDPEFISRDTRKILVERLKNVMKEDTHQHDHVVHESKRSSTTLSHHQKNKMPKSRDFSNSKNKTRHSNSLEDGFLRRKDKGKEEIQEESSPRNLVRSLSAPVSGTSFGKLLLEDRHMLTGAHIRRKQEATVKATTNVNERKKEKFNLKEKVTNLKQSITLKGKLFGRKSHSHSSEEEHDILEVNPNRSSITTSFYDQPEDYTEVPPSPASLSSCIHDVSMQPTEHFSSTSISDEASTDDNLNTKAFMQINSNLKELQRQLNVSNTDASEDTMVDEHAIEDNLPEIEDQAEAYIRDLLIVSGLYDGSIYQSLSRLEPTVSIQVFEEVEESFRHKINDNDQGSRNDDQCEKINHKMLFDLLNETLPRILVPRNTTMSLMTQVQPRGKKLLDQVWQIMRVYVYPAVERAQYSLDTMLGKDMKSSFSWYTLMDDDVNDLGKDIECQIIGDLICEMVKDMLPKRRARRKG